MTYMPPKKLDEQPSWTTFKPSECFRLFLFWSLNWKKQRPHVGKSATKFWRPWRNSERVTLHVFPQATVTCGDCTLRWCVDCPFQWLYRFFKQAFLAMQGFLKWLKWTKTVFLVLLLSLNVYKQDIFSLWKYGAPADSNPGLLGVPEYAPFTPRLEHV